MRKVWIVQDVPRTASELQCLRNIPQIDPLAEKGQYFLYKYLGFLIFEINYSDSADKIICWYYCAVYKLCVVLIFQEWNTGAFFTILSEFKN